MFMLNLKPAKMVGIQSEGMIMCVSEGEKVEILVPPPGAAVGDRVTCPDYQGMFSSPSTLKISDRIANSDTSSSLNLNFFQSRMKSRIDRVI